MYDRPFFLAERIDAVVGDHAAGIAVIGAETEQPLVAHMGQVRIGAADPPRLAEFEHVGRHRHPLGRSDRPEKRHDIRLRGQFRKRQPDAWIGGLVVLDTECELLAEAAPSLIDRSERELRTILRPKPLLRRGTRHRYAHSDLDGRGFRPPAAGYVRCANTKPPTRRKVA